MVEPLFPETEGLDVPVPVKDGEGLAMFEDPRVVIDPRGGGEDIIFLVHTDDFAHTVLPTSPRASQRPDPDSTSSYTCT